MSSKAASLSFVGKLHYRSSKILKKIIAVLMAVGLALGAVGTSFAFFEDTETSTGNIFTAGTLDLDCIVCRRV